MRGRRRAAACAAALALLMPLLPAGAQDQPRSAGGAARPAAGEAKPAGKAKPAADAASAGVGGGSYAQRYAALCAACHGANGRSDVPGTPVLAGQPAFYTITQLFLFREGRRSNEAMTAVAKTMKDDDLRGFSEFIGTLPPVPAPAPPTPPDAARMSRGQALAQQHKCVFCHGADLGGGQQVPRIAGQHEEYLQMTLQGFRSGKRAGYTHAMTEAVSQIPPEDLDTLAYYAARFPGAAARPAGK